MKRYVAEPGSDLVRTAMQEADAWLMCRVGFVECARAVWLSAGARAVAAFHGEWPALGVIEVDQALAEHAAELALSADLGSLDALHLAAALLPASDALTLATWDRRLHSAATDHGLAVLPRDITA